MGRAKSIRENTERTSENADCVCGWMDESVCVCVCVRERERERPTQRERQREQESTYSVL